MAYTGLRIHPALGIARVGNSEEYYLGPESMAGMDMDGQAVITDDLPIKPAPMTGGLPIKPDTEDSTILSTDLRDRHGRLKRQAARFRIYQYAFADPDGAETYPAGQGSEVIIGSTVDGKQVKDIVWTVHLANKKANNWHAGEGVAPFQDGALPSLRNAGFGKADNPADPLRLKKLIIDAGPRALAASTRAMVCFDTATQSSFADHASGAVTPLPNYPASFPSSLPSAGRADGDGLAASNSPSKAITSLGAITSESQGRLLVLGGYGRACGFDAAGNYSEVAELNGNVNNDNWFDDTADGPVTALLMFDDGSTRVVEGSAWVVSSDPSYAPQTPNVVSLWDDLYCTWLEKFALQPAVYRDGAYQAGFKTDFTASVLPILRAASLQKWNTSLPKKAIAMHDQLGKLTAKGPGFPIMNFIRDPGDDASAQIGTPLMPLSLGDAGKSFLSLTPAQYFFMQQWADGLCDEDADHQSSLGPGEALDKTVLFNCLGGRYSPGIEMSFIVRDVQLYKNDWRKHGSGGPFRINMQPLDYRGASKDTPFLGVGYVPLRGKAVQPGDLCKFMAIPWHTDYNSCATHLPDPNPGGRLTENNIDAATDVGGNGINTLLYSSWPAQRPVAVYTYDDVAANGGKLTQQRFSVRGAGTRADQPAGTETHRAQGQNIERPAMNVGRYQDRRQFVLNWHRLGVVMQGSAIVPKAGAKEINSAFYLEVESQFDTDESNLAEYWRNTVIDKVYPPENNT